MGVVTSYTFTNVQINHSINAIFKIIQYTITVSAGAGGSISPSGIVTVNYGTNQSFTITPNNGYQVSNVTVDGISLGTVTSYTFTNVQTNRSISATFIVGDYISANIGTLKPIPSGTFQRDSSASDISSVSAFYMSRYDITRAQYSNVIGSDPSQISCSTGTSDPVQEVNWYMALVFCNKLSMLEGLTPVYTISGSTDPTTWGAIPTSENDATWDAVTANWSANGYRLPTEMEYMWADMGATNDALSGDIVGGVNTGGYAKGYAGSTEAGGAQVNITSYAWLGNNANNTTHPVGILLPNELGLYDMSSGMHGIGAGIGMRNIPRDYLRIIEARLRVCSATHAGAVLPALRLPLQLLTVPIPTHTTRIAVSDYELFAPLFDIIKYYVIEELSLGEWNKF